ncbi:MAG: PIN domain-containing protein [Thermoanaerobaculia bacterium]
MNEDENARRQWTRAWRSLAIAGFVASLAVGCASDARSTAELATNSETHPVTSVSPSTIAATQEKDGSEGEVAVAELAPGPRALGPANPAAGPAVVVNQSDRVTTTSTSTGPQATTGVMVVGEDAGVVVAPGAVVAPAVAGAPVTAGAAAAMTPTGTEPATAAATTAGGAGPAVVPPASVPAVPTGVATGVTSVSSTGTTTVTPPAVAPSAADRVVTGVAGGPLPTSVGGSTVPSAGVAGPAVAAPTAATTVTNSPTGTVIRVEPNATTAAGVTAVDEGTAVLGARTTRPAEGSRVEITNRDDATAPVIIETPQRRSLLPWRNRAAVTRMLNTWSPASQTAARTAMSVYGQPDQLTDRRMVWTNRSPWARIEVMRDPVAQIEPGVDSGMIVHTIVYPVTTGQAQELRRFNRNIRIDPASGEISVRGVSEAANLLALNLIDEIVRGTRDADDALRFYRDALRDGVITSYEQRLMFTPRTRAARR